VLLAAIGCQGSSPRSSEAATSLVEVRDAKGTVVDSVQKGKPCRTQFEGTQLEVQDGKLAAGSAHWTTEKRPNGTAMMKDGEMVARMVELQEEKRAARVEFYDPKGIAIVRVSRLDGYLSVGDAGSRRVRQGNSGSDVITVGDLYVSGTDDLLLAGVVTATEVPPEVRALAVCK
jgi:hypothetical protein